MRIALDSPDRAVEVRSICKEHAAERILYEACPACILAGTAVLVGYSDTEFEALGSSIAWLLTCQVVSLCLYVRKTLGCSMVLVALSLS